MMKKLLGALILVGSLTMVMSCSDDSDDDTSSSNPTTNCDTSNNGCGEFTTCCTSTSCYYEYDGTKYPCDGTDCQQAAQDLVNDMCDYESAVDFDEKVDDALATVVCGK